MEGRDYEKNVLELVRATRKGHGLFVKNEEDMSSVFCSELVANAYQQLGLLDTADSSNSFMPKDFSSENHSLKLLNGLYLNKEVYIATSFSA